MKRAFPVIAASLLGFGVLQALVFHGGAYPYIVSTDSSTGLVETVLHNERIRVKRDANQVLGIGDSRMALVAKVANALTPETGYEFGTIAAAGSTPRCWYYMLRAADPGANHYKAILISIESYDDEDTVENQADRESDLNYVIPHLGWSDLKEFSMSYDMPERQWRAARGIALKGLVYQRDFQDLVQAPLTRWRTVRQSWRDSHVWFYDYIETGKSLAGLTVDFEHGKVMVPPGTNPGTEEALKRTLLDPLPPQNGTRAKYLGYWVNRIYDLYRGSQTRLIFVRLPRGPFIRPDLPSKPESVLRKLARQPNVSLTPENLFEALEKPEYFRDEVHMNQAGLDYFSQTIARQVREILGPAH
ncbi:MAG: hypothetical protein ABI811_11615 [Acidobacteriota bacterium]